MQDFRLRSLDHFGLRNLSAPDLAGIQKETKTTEFVGYCSSIPCTSKRVSKFGRPVLFGKEAREAKRRNAHCPYCRTEIITYKHFEKGK